MKESLDLRVTVGIDQPPLSAAAEPDPPSLLEDRGESFRPEVPGAAAVQHDQVPGSLPSEHRLFSGSPGNRILHGGRNDRDQGARAPGELDETANDTDRHSTATAENERSAGHPRHDLIGRWKAPGHTRRRGAAR